MSSFFFCQTKHVADNNNVCLSTCVQQQHQCVVQLQHFFKKNFKDRRKRKGLNYSLFSYIGFVKRRIIDDSRCPCYNRFHEKLKTNDFRSPYHLFLISVPSTQKNLVTL